MRRGGLALALAAAGAACLAAPLAAAPLRAPQLKASPYTVRDYPQSALRNDEMGYARIRVTVSPQGKPIGCSVIDSTDIASLDKASCEIMLKRGKFTPAHDAAGQPSYGVIRTSVPWYIGFNPADMRAIEARNRPPDIDIVVAVAALPAGLAAPLALLADVQVSATGRITGCNAEAGGAVPAELAQLACVQARTLGRPQPARDGSDAPVASVQQLKLAFVVEPATK